MKRRSLRLSEIYLSEVILSTLLLLHLSHRHRCLIMIDVILTSWWIDLKIGWWRGGGQLSSLYCSVWVSSGRDHSQAGNLGLTTTLDGHSTLTHTTLSPGAGAAAQPRQGVRNPARLEERPYLRHTATMTLRNTANRPNDMSLPSGSGGNIVPWMELMSWHSPW